MSNARSQCATRQLHERITTGDSPATGYWRTGLLGRPLSWPLRRTIGLLTLLVSDVLYGVRRGCTKQAGALEHPEPTKLALNEPRNASNAFAFNSRTLNASRGHEIHDVLGLVYSLALFIKRAAIIKNRSRNCRTRNAFN